MKVMRWNPDSPLTMKIALDKKEQALVKEEFDKVGFKGKFENLKVVKKE